MTERPIALVTGAAQGIGYACAEALAEDGHRVVLADIKNDVHDAASMLGDGAVAMDCDMGDPAQIHALFGRIEAEIGSVATLVNNAGIALPGDFLAALGSPPGRELLQRLRRTNGPACRSY